MQPQRLASTTRSRERRHSHLCPGPRTLGSRSAGRPGKRPASHAQGAQSPARRRRRGPADEAPPAVDEAPSTQLVPVHVAQALVMVAGQQAQLADQAATRLTGQEAVLHSQAARIAALEHTLSRARGGGKKARDEARKVADELARRRFHWPWQAKE